MKKPRKESDPKEEFTAQLSEEFDKHNKLTSEAIKSYHERVATRIANFFSNPPMPSQEAQTAVGADDGADFRFLKWEIPGVWVDRDGSYHYDVAWLLQAFELEDTAINREKAANYIAHTLRQSCPDMEIRVRGLDQ